MTALSKGDLHVEGRLPWSSNFTFLLNVTHGEETFRAIYKPLEGEEPLWDFPDGLYRREVAAYELALCLGWPNIPETVVRDDGPYGVGSLQRWIDADFEQHYFTFGNEPDLQDTLKEMAVFDMVANNADRKAGHCLLDAKKQVWGIDHGLTFHPEPKLRTVIWEFGGQAVPEHLLTDLSRIQEEFPEKLSKLLSPEEIDATRDRVREILANPVFPEVEIQRQYPWPLV